MPASATESVLRSLEGPLRAIGSVVLPSPEALDEEGWRAAEAIIEKALVSRPSVVKKQIRLFLRAVNLLPVFSTGRTLVGLSQTRRAAFLRRMQRSRLMPLRRGLWGIRTLLFMGYYNQTCVRAEIGYGADPRGWSAHVDGAADGESPKGGEEG